MASIFLIIACSAAVADKSGKPLTNADVTALASAGLGDDVIIAKIQQAPKEALDVSTDGLIALKKAGVSKTVIEAMIRRADKRDTRATSASTSNSALEREAPAPPSIGVIYFLNSETNSLLPLERQMGYTQKRGMIKQEIVYSVPQERSSVRLKSSLRMQFVVAGTDASSYYLYRFSINDRKRELILAESTMTGSRANYVAVPVDVTKYGEGYKITPSQPLIAGEYVFSQLGKNDASCFGVDNDTSGTAESHSNLIPRLRGGSYQSPVVFETDFAAADRSLWNGGKEFTIPDWYEMGKVSCDGVWLRGDSDRKRGWDPFIEMRAKDLLDGNVEVKMAVGVQNPKHNEDKLATLLLEVLNGRERVASETVAIKAKDDGEGHFKTVVFTVPARSLHTTPMTKLRVTMSTSGY
ncbi:MAG: hypothetical protein ACRD16_04095 [Thermoanaerobaculia bacterium]